MRFHFRTTRRLGPVRVTLTERGLRWGLKAWRWSWNPRTRRHAFNTPGLGYVRTSGRRRPAHRASSDRSLFLGLIGLALTIGMLVAWGPPLWTWFS
jgi:hypothetical protein